MFPRIWLIAKTDLLTYLKRPMVWVWIVLLGLLYWGLASGDVRIGTGGDATIGGSKQHLSSEFEVSRIMSALMMIIHGFFATVLFGMAVIRDQESKIMPLLNSSRLKITEYLAAKLLGCLLLISFVLSINALLLIFFMYVVSDPTRSEYIGPFAITNFVWPTLKFLVPAILLLGGLSFALGTITRKAVLIFVFPIILLLVFGLFLNNWSPVWLPEWVNLLLCYIDPYGVRWLNETYFNVDRGAEYYNTQPVSLSVTFLLSRLMCIAIGIGAFGATIPIFRKQLLGRHGSLSAVNQKQVGHVERSQNAQKAAVAGVGSLGMTQGSGGLISDTWNIVRYELKELRSSPSLFLFVPFIIVEVVGTSFLNEGAFGTPMLQTAGSLASSSMPILAILGCLLMMFYTVESQMRERVKKLAPIFYSTPARSFAILLGKSIANTAVCLVIAMAALVACFGILLYQGTVTLEIGPFLIYWLLLLMPTYIFWGSFITLAIVITRSRYTTYAAGAGALIGTLYLDNTGDTSWLTNWMLIGIVPWSDISSVEMDRTALFLNRLLVLSLSVGLTFLATQFFWRRGVDSVQLASRFKFRPLLRFAFGLVPFLIVPIVLSSVLWSLVNQGFEGDKVRKLEKEYWKQNVSTWSDVKSPSVSGANIDLTIEPDQSRLSVKGILRLQNKFEEPMKRFVLTGAPHWKDVQWELGKNFVADESTPKIPDGKSLDKFEPEDRSRLYVFELETPLKPGESIALGYSFNGQFLDGISKNGGGAAQFILPSGVVLNSFTNSFVPMAGFVENAGLDSDDIPESKNYAEDFFEEELKPLFGSGGQFHVRTKITGPKEFMFNGVGIKISEEESGDLRTVCWESDSPISFFNVVGGQWKVMKSDSTEVYYNAKHDFNVRQISEALEASRTWYSTWFAPYPWKELRLSEFADLSTYAQGFPTNIVFSEGIGFLTKDIPGADAPFLVTAHEAAHQWWGNILVPGQGPGGNILSEGMAHFSTGLLFDQVKGEQARRHFFELIEDRYNNQRSVDSERPMVEIDGSKGGDTTVMYDKGGWVFWMLLNHMGRTENLQGIQSFILKYKESKDHPVLQDFVAHMRAYSGNPEKFDKFANQWFFEVVVPEYKFENVEMKQVGDSWRITGTVQNKGTGEMPLEICAAVNQRTIDREDNPEYQDSRTTVQIGGGESLDFELEVNFKPDRVIVDPDFKVLQLKRKSAKHEF